MTTGIPCEARIAGANSDPRYASRFFLVQEQVSSEWRVTKWCLLEITSEQSDGRCTALRTI